MRRAAAAFTSFTSSPHLARNSLHELPAPTGRPGEAKGRDARSVRAGDHLHPAVGHRPLRFPLRLLHVRGDDLPAQGRAAHAGGARPAGLDLRRSGRAQDPAHRRRAPGPAQHHVADRRARPARARGPAGRADRDHQRQPARAACRRRWCRPACGGSTSRSTRSIPERFRAITRWGKYEKVLAGIEAAKRAGLQVKINAVALKGVNEDELDRMLAWCGAEGFDLTLIETMPMGEIDGDRTEQYLPLSVVRARLAQRWTLDRHRLPDRRARPATCGWRRRAAGSASSPRSRTISASPATGSG